MKNIIYLLLLVLNTCLYADNFFENKNIKKIFDENSIKGSFAVYDQSTNTYIGYNSKRAYTQFYPGSTFKIFNSLIGLSEGVVQNVDEIFYKYKGEKVFLPSWASDASLRTAIKISQVPAYQELARKIGFKKMQKNLDKLNYGNKNIGNKIDEFWLKGPVKISLIEQIDLLNKLANEKLPYSKKIQEEVIDITTLEKNENWILHGKTGWATENIETPVGWFIGWVEKADKIYPFAINIDAPTVKSLPKREEMAKLILKYLEILD